jgi:ABC-type long-subunit fatty acid transport system fused permease/ATPase subunit
MSMYSLFVKYLIKLYYTAMGNVYTRQSDSRWRVAQLSKTMEHVPGISRSTHVFFAHTVSHVDSNWNSMNMNLTTMRLTRNGDKSTMKFSATRNLFHHIVFLSILVGDIFKINVSSRDFKEKMQMRLSLFLCAENTAQNRILPLIQLRVVKPSIL